LKIVDCLIWNDAFEQDLLYLKLLLESNCVDKWYISHNHYNYHGEYKGDTLSPILQQFRFKSFLDRIQVVELNHKFGDPTLASRIDPGEYANAEWELRDAPFNQGCLDLLDDNDRVFSSDVDEMIDFSDEERKNRMLVELKTDDPIQFDRVRFIYDYDNIAHRSRFDMITPSFKIKHLRNGQAKLRDKKWVGRQVPNGIRPMIFEYCHVFGYEGYIKKHMSSLHTQWIEEKLKFAILTNTWPKTAYQGPPDPNNRWEWFEKIKLNDDNSPRYVREILLPNQENLVPQDYIENRIKVWGFNPTFTANGDGNYDV